MHIILPNKTRKVISLLIVFILCVFSITACSTDTAQTQEHMPEGGYTVSEIELPFADQLGEDKKVYYDSWIHDDILEIFLAGGEDRKIGFFEWYE